MNHPSTEVSSMPAIPTEAEFMASVLTDRPQSERSFRNVEIDCINPDELQTLGELLYTNPINLMHEVVIKNCAAGIPGQPKNNFYEQLWELTTAAQKGVLYEQARSEKIFNAKITDDAFQPAYALSIVSNCRARTPLAQAVMLENWDYISKTYLDRMQTITPMYEKAVWQTTSHFLRRLHDGTIGTVEDYVGILERLSTVGFTLQDPLCFMRDWRRMYPDQPQASFPNGYYCLNTHEIFVPLGIFSRRGLSQTINHEITHSVSAASYRYDEVGAVIPVRAGLYAATTKSADMSQGSFTSANEAETESEQLRILNQDTLMKAAAYLTDRMIRQQILNLATQRRPDIDLQSLYEAAYYQQPRSPQLTPHRWPARKALNRAIGEIFTPGFQNCIESSISVIGLRKTLALLVEDWQSVSFHKPIVTARPSRSPI